MAAISNSSADRFSIVSVQPGSVVVIFSVLPSTNLSKNENLRTIQI